MRMSGLLLASLAMVAIVSSAQARPSAPATAADDVRELGKSIEQLHPAPFRSISKAKFRAEVNALAQRAPASSRNEMLVGVLRIIALLGPRNGHTGLFPGDSAHSRPLSLYPLRLYDFSDGIYVVDARDEALVRSRLVAIEGTSVERVLELVRPLTPSDNPSNLRGLAPHFLLTAEVLDGLGVTDGAGPATFTLERPDGQRTDVQLTADTRAAVRRRIRRAAPRAQPVVAPVRLATALPGGRREAALGTGRSPAGAPSMWATTPCARRRRRCCGRSSGSCARRALAASSSTCGSTAAATTRRTES